MTGPGTTNLTTLMAILSRLDRLENKAIPILRQRLESAFAELMDNFTGVEITYLSDWQTSVLKGESSDPTPAQAAVLDKFDRLGGNDLVRRYFVLLDPKEIDELTAKL